ncbi:hypothetical protein [Delftia acidovorans]|uniref:hypothetical protein n=1 Tax=Delftia acidovorans TaxID=80866 RepID=UPI001C0C4CFA|nr:hypothetical protein [Delftia acidovorans]
MAASQLQPKKLNVLPALVYFLLFMDDLYLDAATSNTLENNYAAKDQRQKWNLGERPSEEDVNSWQTSNAEQLRVLRTGFWKSGLWTVAIIAISLVLLWICGRTIPLNCEPKMISAIGGALAAWGTIFQLTRVGATYKGTAAHELMRPPLFLLLFVPGSVLAIAGTLA